MTEDHKGFPREDFPRFAMNDVPEDTARELFEIAIVKGACSEVMRALYEHRGVGVHIHGGHLHLMFQVPINEN